jgi:hypothetical protein
MRPPSPRRTAQARPRRAPDLLRLRSWWPGSRWPCPAPFRRSMSSSRLLLQPPRSRQASRRRRPRPLPRPRLRRRLLRLPRTAVARTGHPRQRTDAVRTGPVRPVIDRTDTGTTHTSSRRRSSRPRFPRPRPSRAVLATICEDQGMPGKFRRLRPTPWALAIGAWDIWRRLPPQQRRQLLRLAGKHGPKLAARAAKAAQSTRRRPRR